MPMREDSKTLCVIEFSNKASKELIDFIIKKVEASTEDGGAELQCRLLENNTKVRGQRSGRVLHVECGPERLLQIADYVDMKKLCINGTLQVFCVDRLDYFENSADPEKLFTRAEKQRMVLHELEAIRCSARDFTLPGHSSITVQYGSSILKQCIHKNLISQIYPTHDEQLRHLEEKWYRQKSFFLGQPLHDIKDYFGETIGMYFGFLEFYSSALLLPSIVGLFYYALQLHKDNMYSLIVYAVFNLIWSTAFLEGWKRRSSALAYKWGTTDIRIIEEARPNYYGPISKNPVTDKLEPRYPKWKRLCRIYLVSAPVVTICLLVGVAAMLAYFKFEFAVVAWYKTIEKPHYGYMAVSFVPTIVYSVAIIVMNQLYRPLAIKLNEWENHRLQSTFDNHLTVKLVLFWFINTFMLMFYVAFYLQDLHMLWKTLLTELIVTQSVDQLQETLIPYCLYKMKVRNRKTEVETKMEKYEKEALKPEYEGTFDDFLELFIQFGYVTLFSCVFPLAGFLAFVNNVIEQRSDAFKLCRIHQRPFSKPAAGTGAWQTVFELMGYLALITNSALIGLCIHQGNLLPNTTPLEIVLIVIALEHVLILLRVTIAYIIPDEPKWVQIALARDSYQLKTKAFSQSGAR